MVTFLSNKSEKTIGLFTLFILGWFGPDLFKFGPNSYSTACILNVSVTIWFPKLKNIFFGIGKHALHSRISLTQSRGNFGYIIFSVWVNGPQTWVRFPFSACSYSKFLRSSTPIEELFSLPSICLKYFEFDLAISLRGFVSEDFSSRTSCVVLSSIKVHITAFLRRAELELHSIL